MSARLVVAPSKADVPMALTSSIVSIVEKSLQAHNAFTIALSGGSLPGFLSTLPNAFEAASVDPCWNKWHVLLADERCVPSTHADSNFGALQTEFLANVGIPESQIHGINETKLQESTQAVANDYETIVRNALILTGGMLDLAVLGFGPDGHTCSLFPNHALLKEGSTWVAAIEDSPKPPSQRITLTFSVLNHYTRHVIFCGAGASKQTIVQASFRDFEKRADNTNNDTYQARLVSPPPYPCAMVTPRNSLTWIVDADAVTGLDLSPSPPTAYVYVQPTKSEVGNELCAQIVQVCAQALVERGVFTIALSGGSLPSLLSDLSQAFAKAEIDPQFSKWYVILADERCVPVSHEDSNLGALQTHLLGKIEIPPTQVYGIDESKFSESTEAVAQAYEDVVQNTLQASGGALDLAVLGFGPDGHTCSLFPNHALLQETSKRMVAPITDSPKSPLNRVTLTLHFLNELTRNVIFCGAGESKSPILQSICSNMVSKSNHWQATIQPVYPCGMVHPTAAPNGRLMYVVDQPAIASVERYTKTQRAKVLVAPTKAEVPEKLNAAIVKLCHEAVSTRGVFTIALSGGSLPSFLSSLPESFAATGVDPCWDKWHVLLADERCVPFSDADSNLGSLQHNLLSKIGVPASQIYGIDEKQLSSTNAVATAYESILRTVLSKTSHYLDLAVLGFGPDGHTCSLFPNHALLEEYSKWVAPIEDSPKPPLKRITLTLKVLNELTRNVIFCGAGSSKEPILKDVFGHPHVGMGMDYHVSIQNDPAPYPCAKVDPLENFIWVVDKDAMPKTEGW